MKCCVLLYDCPVSAVSGDVLEPSGLVSPSSTVRSLTKELQHSLDLASATSGDKVVTAQVSEASFSPRNAQKLNYAWCSSLPIYCTIDCFVVVFFRKMRMSRLHLRVEDKLQALSVHVPTLVEN